MKDSTLYSFFFLLFLFIFTCSKTLNAQGWERTYGASVNYKGQNVMPTADGGYVFAVSADRDPVFVFEDIKVIKTNSRGDTLWTKTFTDIDPDNGHLIQTTSDGGYIIAGMETTTNTGLIQLIKLYADGSQAWRKNISSPWSTLNLAGYWSKYIMQTPDGGFVVAGQLNYGGGGTSDAFLIKTSAQGILEWGRKFMISWLRINSGEVVELTGDGGYLLSGNSESGSFVIKCDKDGYETWLKNYSRFHLSDARVAAGGDGYIIAGENLDGGNMPTSIGTFLIRLNTNGDTLWTKKIAEYDSLFTTSIALTDDGGYCIAGKTNANLSGGSDIVLMKTNSEGNITWTKHFGKSFNDFSNSVRLLAGGGYIISGTVTEANSKTSAYLVRTDSRGNFLSNEINGRIFEDINTNCISEPGERGLRNADYWKIKIMPGNLIILPDSFGYYHIQTDTGKFTVSLINKHPFLEVSCPVPSFLYTVDLTNFYDTASGKNFGLNSSLKCPIISIDVSSSLVRPCMEAFHKISYCNDGTADANGAYVEVTLDTKLNFVSSSFTPNVHNGGFLKYNLPVLHPGECGEIIIYTTVACNAERNSSVCIKAKAYPDSICKPADPIWDKSSIKVTGRCINNSKTRFVITNTGKFGEGDMQGDNEYRIFIDNALVQRIYFRLKGGDSLFVELNPCGKTVRMEADQRPGHPGNSRPRATVEGCGMNDIYCTNASYSVGQLTGVPLDNADASMEEECVTVSTSFDPNEKRVIPSGITAKHYVSKNELLEYRINFQNTGNDTAFRIILLDTIDTQVLDIASLVPGLSSHPCRLTIKDNNILEWVFENINLPDSNINEKDSHGYVKFKINQLRDLSTGTNILNRAAIYFDFNLPVFTEPTRVIIKDTVLVDLNNYNIITGIFNLNNRDQLLNNIVSVFPNPFQTSCIIKINSSIINTHTHLGLLMYDFSGRKVKEVFFKGNYLELQKEGLPKGIYFFEVLNKNKRIGMGKLIVQ